MKQRNAALGALLALVLIAGSEADTGKAAPSYGVVLATAVAAEICGGSWRDGGAAVTRNCLTRAFDLAGEGLALARQF
ncbi:hypothetical protein FHS83_002786 [Rhizomicrobium palustre]|uniref:Uncharacterized protein n=1 Tax=Rhizomicrobium palustre TaxID=189966 RepID=A0A846N0P1_9PROT|nr:hypothetical protein [Rhizomicrobium palustre]NIK89468.1 hypothetical protein [Rhizomicrobium palustre]